MNAFDLYKLVVEKLETSPWGWVAEISLLLILTFATIQVIAITIYSESFQKMWHDVKNFFFKGGIKVREANSSPFDKSAEESTLLSWVSIFCLYTISLFIFIFSLAFIIISVAQHDAEISFTNKLISLGVYIIFLFVSRMIKVQADKTLYKLKKKT